MRSIKRTSRGGVHSLKHKLNNAFFSQKKTFETRRHLIRTSRIFHSRMMFTKMHYCFCILIECVITGCYFSLFLFQTIEFYLSEFSSAQFLSNRSLDTLIRCQGMTDESNCGVHRGQHTLIGLIGGKSKKTKERSVKTKTCWKPISHQRESGQAMSCQQCFHPSRNRNELELTIRI